MPGAALHRAWGRPALDRLARCTVLFRAGDWILVTFGVLAAAGTWLSLALAGAILIGQGLSPGSFAVLALAGCGAVVVGSWLAAQLLDARLVLQRRRPIFRPAFVSWGGLLGLLGVGAVLMSASGQSVLALLDALARAIPLGHAIGRLGCLTYGCCHGRPAQRGLTVVYHHPDAKAVRVSGLGGVPLHPAPLYEAALQLGVFALTNGVAAAGAPLGWTAAIGMVAYGAVRFAVELTRDNEGRRVAGRLSVNHLFALAFAAAGAAIAAALLARGSAPAPPVAWSTSLAAAPALLAATVPAALLVLLGFGLHRGRVGAWTSPRRTRRIPAATGISNHEPTAAAAGSLPLPEARSL